MPIRGVRNEFESVLRRITHFAFRNAEHILRSAPQGEDPLADDVRRHTFIDEVHRGFSAAQDCVAEELLKFGRPSEGDGLIRKKVALLRKVTDGIAWQLISHHLYIARRLYREQQPVDLLSSNFASVRKAAAHYQADDYSQFALMSDLTSFVQVGDLLVKQSNGNVAIIEVKEGEKNEQIGDFLDTFAEAPSYDALRSFYEQHGPKGYQQLMRMTRQVARMSAITSLINKDEGVDFDSKQRITVNREAFGVDGYDDQLSDVINDALRTGSSVTTVDDCFLIGAFAREMRHIAPLAFRSVIRKAGFVPKLPIANLMTCMSHPLALPIYLRAIPVEQTFDLLFDRVAVFMLVDLDRFMKKASEIGVPMRWSTRKEAAKMGGDFGATRIDNRVPIADIRDDMQIALGDGPIFRILYHGTRPVSAIVALAKSASAA